MIQLKDIPVADIEAFWALHIGYLLQDGLISDAEDVAYFQGDEYRAVIRDHMRREQDKHHLAYFEEDGRRIGAVSYCTFQSEDGKCLILDFWIFPEFRRKGKGHACFAALCEHTKLDGARYYVINCDGRADRLRFWKSLGFVENGKDEWDMPLMIRR